MGFSRQEYWNGLSCPPPGDLPDPGMEPPSPASPSLAGGFFTTEPLAKPHLQSPLFHLGDINILDHENSEFKGALF